MSLYGQAYGAGYGQEAYYRWDLTVLYRGIGTADPGSPTQRQGWTTRRATHVTPVAVVAAMQAGCWSCRLPRWVMQAHHHTRHMARPAANCAGPDTAGLLGWTNEGCTATRTYMAHNLLCMQPKTQLLLSQCVMHLPVTGAMLAAACMPDQHQYLCFLCYTPA